MNESIGKIWEASVEKPGVDFRLYSEEKRPRLGRCDGAVVVVVDILIIFVFGIAMKKLMSFVP